MLCSNCVKLAFIASKRKCIRCSNETTNGICVLCDFCSGAEKQCAVCVKKISEYYLNKSFTRNCGCKK